MDWFLNPNGNYGVCFYIETKLQIDDDTQRKNHRDYKVISQQRERQFKILMISMTIISIILMIVSLYLKWWIVFGIAIAMLFVVAVALIIYENILRRSYNL